MLASFLVLLRPKTLALLGRTIGRSLHGLLINLLADASPALADRLHSPTPIEPFTVSMLHGRLLRQGDQRLASPETRRAYCFRGETLCLTMRVKSC